MARQTAPRFGDVRWLFRDDEASLSQALLKNWPAIPARSKDSATSGLDCVAILCGAIFSTLDLEHIPEAREDDNGFVQYVFSYFKQDDRGYLGKLSESTRIAMQDATGGTENKAVGSFASLCRCQAMIDLLWRHPRYQLTQPWVLKGPGQPKGGKVCKSREDISRDGILKWDGSKPDTMEELVSNVTMTKRTMGANKDNYKVVCFNSPEILQLDLTQGQDSRCSLQSIWRFWADTYLPVQVDGDKDMIEFQKDKKIAYIVMAIIRHRKDPMGSDSIRLFREDGMEQLPDALAANETMPDWQFNIDDVIPAGEKLSIIYSSYPSLDRLPPPHEVKRQVEVPDSIEADMVATLEGNREVAGSRHAAPPARDLEEMIRRESNRGHHQRGRGDESRRPPQGDRRGQSRPPRGRDGFRGKRPRGDSGSGLPYGSDDERPSSSQVSRRSGRYRKRYD